MSKKVEENVQVVTTEAVTKRKKNLKEGELALAWVIAIYGLLAALFLIAVISLVNWWHIRTAAANMSEVVTKVDNTLGDLTHGASCDSFTMANFESLFGRGYTFNSTDSSLTLPKGEVVATLTCTNSPKASGSGPLRGELTFTGVGDSICSKFVSNEVDLADAIQTKSDSASSTTTVKYHNDVDPTGLALIGKTACPSGSTSTVNVWLQGQ